jgi:hypothetical protein
MLELILNSPNRVYIFSPPKRKQLFLNIYSHI